MRWSSLNSPLGLTDTSNRKLNAFLGAAGLIGTMLDWDAQTSANAINRQNAIETNQLNREINEQQIAWAREKYREEKAENRFLVDQAYRRELENRAYNSPQAQKLRFQQAGINPYLAMYGSGSSGGVSSIGATVGSPPKYDNPSMIPMQAGAPAQAYTGFGRGISDAVAAYYTAKDAERKDYQLASDITFRDNAQRQKTLDQFIDIKNSGIESKWIDGQIEHLAKSLQFEREKFERQKVVEDANISIEKFRSETERYATQIQEMLASSQVELSRSQCMRIASEISSTEQQVKEMIANGISQRRINQYIAQREKEAAKMAEIERKNLDYSGNKSVEKHVRAWKKTMDILFQPIKGLISVSFK